MVKQVRNRYYFIGDVILLALAAYISFVLRLEERDLGNYRAGFLLFVGLALVVTPTVFRFAGVYGRYWRYASVEELLLLSGSVTVAVVVISIAGFLVAWLFPGMATIPRSIPVIFLLLALVATAGPRLAIRLVTYGDRHSRGPVHRRPVLVMGAGDAGRMIVREMRENPQLGMDVVGFLDDDVGKHGVRINSVPVLGACQHLRSFVEQYDVEQVIIAMPTAPGKLIRGLVHICEQAGVQTKTIPGIYELLGGEVSVDQLRKVEIEDLLRRAPIQTDIGAVRELVRGKRVLVTGAGGSIGSELCRQVVRCDPAELIIVGHGENSVFETQNELLRLMAASAPATGKYGADSTVASRLKAVIADIRFADRIRSIFEEYQPEIVFHAAAHKHVPLMEDNPAEAITNNVLGTRNLLDAAMAVGVDRFVMISTDKAVNPTSIMGASKRAAELLVHRAAKVSGKPYVAVRFGNVLGSRGSVVLTFRQQIAAGGPVSVTHPEMRRYFMTIREAVQLVLQAAVLGKGGEVFVLDMGEPIKIVDLARDMIELSGLEVGQDIDITFTGLRPGEKLFEELFMDGEEYRRTEHEKIFIAGNASSFIPANLTDEIGMLALAAQNDDEIGIRRALRRLVPEFRPTSEQEMGQTEVQQTEEPVVLKLQVGVD